jgi:hypothetical protein
MQDDHEGMGIMDIQGDGEVERLIAEQAEEVLLSEGERALDNSRFPLLERARGQLGNRHAVKRHASSFGAKFMIGIMGKEVSGV